MGEAVPEPEIISQARRSRRIKTSKFVKGVVYFYDTNRFITETQRVALVRALASKPNKDHCQSEPSNPFGFVDGDSGMNESDFWEPD
jgi:hypothetical protein